MPLFGAAGRRYFVVPRGCAIYGAPRPAARTGPPHFEQCWKIPDASYGALQPSVRGHNRAITTQPPPPRAQWFIPQNPHSPPCASANQRRVPPEVTAHRKRRHGNHRKFRSPPEVAARPWAPPRSTGSAAGPRRPRRLRERPGRAAAAARGDPASTANTGTAAGNGGGKGAAPGGNAGAPGEAPVPHGEEEPRRRRGDRKSVV